MAITRLASVAGVRIPDTALCNAAVELLAATSPQFLCNHCLRTYVLGASLLRALAAQSSTRKFPFVVLFCTTLGSFPLMLVKTALKWTVLRLLASFV